MTGPVPKATRGRGDAWRGPYLRIAMAALVLTGAARPARAQRVLLQLRPHAGDTLHMRLDQEMDIARTGPAAFGDPATEATMTSVVLQRMIVEGVDSSGTEIRQVTDSFSTTTADDHGSPAAPRQGLPVVEGQVRLHVAPDGAVTLQDSAGHVNSALREVLANLPVTFPRDPVHVGQTWVRAMKLPAGARYAADSEIRLEFRLDSVSGGTDTAYVSVHGPLGGAHVKSTAGGRTVTTHGTLVGAMVIDRSRGWLADWHARIDVEYTMQPLRGSNEPPSRVRMTAVQWLRTIDRP